MKGIGYLLLTVVLGAYFALTYRASHEECKTLNQLLRRGDRLYTYAVWTIVALGLVALVWIAN